MKSGFDDIVLDGRETITEPVDVRNLGIVGQLSFSRKVEADTVWIRGKAQFSSVITCDWLTVEGQCTAQIEVITEQIKNKHGVIWFYGRVYSNSIISSGEIKSYDVIHSGRINIAKGALVEASGRIKADTVKIFGRLLSTTTVNATEIRINSEKTSEIRSIISDILIVKRKRPEGEKKKEFTLVSDFIDCIEADIECCRIGQLCCDSAIVRSGCFIDELVYSKEVEIEPGAVVERLVKA